MPVSGTTVGSWFSTGFYGHVRNKARNDYVCEYRQLAKPQPPRQFINRSLLRDTSHPFSVHDNRNALMCDAVYFEQGLGKRKHPERAATFDPDFYTWMPLKKEISRSLPHLSSYQTSYASNEVPQLLVHPPKTYPEKSDTTYHYSYDDACPHKQGVKQIAQSALRLSTTGREQTALRNPPQPHESVASCLSWYRRPRRLQRACADRDLAHLPDVPAPPQRAKSGMGNCPTFSPSGPQTSMSDVSTSQVVWPQPVCSQTVKPEMGNCQTVCPQLVPSETAWA